MTLTHQDLASLAGTSRETVTGVLSSFKGQRLISIRGTWVTVLEPGPPDPASYTAVNAIVSDTRH